MAKTQMKNVLQSNDSNKEKAAYLWEYYKWHLMGIILVLLLSIYFTIQLFNRPQVDYHIGVLGPETTTEQMEILSNDLKALLDPEDQKGDMLVTVTQAGQGAERFFAQLAAAEYDLLLVDKTAFENFADSESMDVLQVDDIESSNLFTVPEDNKIIGIESNAIPYFSEHEVTSGLIALVPKNSTRNPETIVFFQKQGISLKIQKSE
ncbi:hypothetical protein SAMN04488569_101343 [Marinilactibacillus piezotolerans]|uniref:Extracellular solute-binding protein n=1 Tax=Marinilactibacillus piezotolerans TaxID=258723 RepID=A0A1I3XBY2_9LACT|nr:hypothetical protein [Marinilactibacillus piezotolerans]SFK17060.1 hypothetical protein SAMN04488569_101343 [Marinilactibacillus piezotolerans]